MAKEFLNKHQKAIIFLGLLIVYPLTIYMLRGSGNILNNLLQGFADLSALSIGVVSSFLYLCYFVALLVIFDSLLIFIKDNGKKLGQLENLKFVAIFIVLVAFYLLLSNSLNQFLVAELGGTDGALRFTPMLSFILLFLYRLFPGKKLFNLDIRTILLTIVFLGFMKRLTMPVIGDFTAPKYEIENLLILVPLLDLGFIEMFMPSKLKHWFNDLKKMTN